MARRTGEAQWEGTLKDGKGRFWTESGEVSGVYSFSTRFEEQQGFPLCLANPPRHRRSLTRIVVSRRWFLQGIPKPGYHRSA